MSEPLFHSPDFTRFYDADNPWDTDKDYCRALAESAGSVLDLGCGTGELATALAGGRRVVGVEPAAAQPVVISKTPKKSPVANRRWRAIRLDCLDGRDVSIGIHSPGRYPSIRRALVPRVYSRNARSLSRVIGVRI